MKPFVLIIAAALGVAFIALPQLIHLAIWAPLDSTQDPIPAANLPEHALVLMPAEATFTAPFQLLPDASSPHGYVAAIPQGSGTPDAVGAAEFTFDTTASFTYTIWLRCRWMDGCGNSLTLVVDDHAPMATGQDAIYNEWHWVKAASLELPAGPHTVTLKEREDGIQVDQLLLVPADSLSPTGPILDGNATQGVRRFADAFDRSPGHGSPDWTFAEGEWHIAFSLDPNRIPHQYSLQAQTADGHRAIAQVTGTPWSGFEAACSILADAGARVGLAFIAPGTTESEVAWLHMDAAAPRIVYEVNNTTEATRDLPPKSLRAAQWYRLSVERWGWSVRVSLDGTLLLESNTLATRALHPGLALERGQALFDDVVITEIPWQADDGGAFRTSWSAPANSRWFRSRHGTGTIALKGQRGSLITGLPLDLPLSELVVWSDDPLDKLLDLPGMAPLRKAAPDTWIYRAEHANQHPPAPLHLAAHSPLKLQRLAWRCHSQTRDIFRIGPYDFAESKIPDPGDYLDFTPEEFAAIQASEDAQKLVRKAKYMDVVGKSGEYAVWAAASGRWHVRDGALNGTGTNARLRFWQEIDADLDMSFRIRLVTADTSVGVVLAEDHDNAACTLLSTAKTATGPEPPTGLTINLPQENQWHNVRLSLRGNQLSAQVDGIQAGARQITRGEGGGILLEIKHGQVQFDDVEFLVPRVAENGRFYGFDRRETDWWRSGETWIDHGGIACALASNWISLNAPEGEGLLINKHPLPQDLLVAFNIEENTEWMGWEQNPSHVHYPFDNIRVCLAPEQGPVTAGYRLEVNANERRQTVLYRENLPVVTVAQDRHFPITYVGGHAPYRPRRNRIKLLRRDNVISVVINGTKVIEYADPEPLTTSRVAVGGYRTNVNFSRIVVRSLAPVDSAGTDQTAATP